MDINNKKLWGTLADSADIFSACERIGNKFNLHIDQIGELDAQIRQILRGKTDSKEFTNNIGKYLEIDKNLAIKITEEANKEIFNTIKSNLQSQTSTNEAINSLEQIGGFTIEPSKPESSNGNGVTSADKEEILAGIENPELNKGNFSQSLNGGGENHTEPLIDYLLSTPVGQAEKKVVTEDSSTKQTQTKNQQRTTIDPYREAVK